MIVRRGSVSIVVVLVIGLGLAFAPVFFSMFGRAPAGGSMIDDFRPYMTAEEIADFREYLDEIGAANQSSIDQLRPALEESGGLGGPQYEARLNGVATLNRTWSDIDADMTDLLDRMEGNLDNYAAVDALPPFAMFPWFFVVPGLVIAGVAATVLWSQRKGRPVRGRVWLLVGCGLAVALAPVAFQMFGRAPEGRDMIDSFRPMMTRERVQAVQGYFVTMGVAEGQFRTVALPLADQTGIDTGSLDAIGKFSEDWPSIVADFNPMVATMSDNVDNFAAVDALPSFALFPWFFLVPGLLVAGCAALALRGNGDDPRGSVTSTADSQIITTKGSDP